MRLIDADEFKRQIAGMAIINNYPADKANKICELIDCQPTAYDTDVIIDEIRKFEICGKCMNNHNSISTCATFCDVGKKLEIVKSGGVEDK